MWTKSQLKLCFLDITAEISCFLVNMDRISSKVVNMCHCKVCCCACYSRVWYRKTTFVCLCMSPRMTKPVKWPVCPTRQINLGIHHVWSEFLLCTLWVAKNPNFLQPEAKTDQIGRMPRLVWVFTGRTGHSVGFVMEQFCRASINIYPSIHPICQVHYSQ